MRNAILRNHLKVFGYTLFYLAGYQQCVWYSNNLQTFLEIFRKLPAIFKCLWQVSSDNQQSLEIFGNLWKGFGWFLVWSVQKFSGDNRLSLEWFNQFSEMLGKHVITFGYFWKALGEFFPPLKYLWWSVVFDCLAHYWNLHCNLHSCYMKNAILFIQSESSNVFKGFIKNLITLRKIWRKKLSCLLW